MQKQLISFAQLIKFCKISSSRWGFNPNTPLRTPLHWLIGSVHGTSKLTIQKLRPAGFARTAQIITTKLYSLMVLFW